jgi:hypothetical protein
MTMKVRMKKTTIKKFLITNNMPQIDETIHHVRCAEYTLQLGNRDGLKKDVATFIAKLRAIVQLLHAPHADAISKRHTGKGALADMPKCWD